jgi:hypothetical protein
MDKAGMPDDVKESGVIDVLFERYDVDKSGTINHAELMQMIKDANAKASAGGAEAPLSPSTKFVQEDLSKALFGNPEIAEGVMKPEGMKYTKTQAAFNEGFGTVNHEGEARLFLQKTSRILLDAGHEDEARGGCVLPVAYWYETFMPKLLEICSAGVEGYSNDPSPDAAVTYDSIVAGLDDWYAAEVDSGRFDKYAGDVRAGWGQLGAAEKLSIKVGYGSGPRALRTLPTPRNPSATRPLSHSATSLHHPEACVALELPLLPRA